LIDSHQDPATFFHQHLQDAIAQLRVRPSATTELYLRDLLVRSVLMRGVRPATADRPLVHLMAAALEAEDARERLRRLREIGDAALYTCGFFGEHVASRGLSPAYYEAMGGRAYRGASVLSLEHRGTFHELADGFAEFSRVLDEVRERTVPRTPQDIVRLYDLWKRTRDPRFAKKLQSQGVFPQGGDDSGTVH
jgi:hypothetical protein